MQKKQKAVAKVATKRSTKQVKAVSKPAKKSIVKSQVKSAPKSKALDYSLRVAAAILAVWGILLGVFAFFNSIDLLNVTNGDTDAQKLVNFFITIMAFMIALISFKAVKAIDDLDEDGFLAAVVVLINMGIVGYNGFSAGVNTESMVFWPLTIVGVLGLIFLIPQSFMFKKSSDHSLTTWAFIVHLMFWFAAIILTSVTANLI